MDQDVTVVAGIVIPSTSPVFLTVVAVHVAIALVAVVCGLVGMLSPKRAGRHSRHGNVYFYALCGVFVSASALSFMRWAENYHLLILGAVAFLTALLARTAIRARWRNWPRLHLLGMWRALPPALYWVIPSVIGVPIMLFVMLRHPLTRARG